MRAIVCVDEKWGIGKNNDLLFSLPLDMKIFRETTMGATVVMGANTLKSFPNEKPLPKRENVVLSTTLDREDVTVFKSLAELLGFLKDKENVFIIGGAKVYKELVPYCEEALVTKVEADGGATVFFPNLDIDNAWEITKKSEKMETNGFNIRFITYKNNDIKKI